MSRILADKVTNYNNDGPFEAEKGINIPLNRPLQVADSPGLAGQVLSSTGNGLTWTTLPNVFSGNYADLTNKPVLFSGSYTDLTNRPFVPTFQITSVSENDYLRYNGTTWVNTSFPTIFTYTYDIYEASANDVKLQLKNNLNNIVSGYTLIGTNGIEVAVVDSTISIVGQSVTSYDPITAINDVSVAFTHEFHNGISFEFDPDNSIYISATVETQDFSIDGSSTVEDSVTIGLYDPENTLKGSVTLSADSGTGLSISWDEGSSTGILSWSDPSPYVLPIASTSELGGIKVDGTTITIDGNGIITANFIDTGILYTDLSATVSLAGSSPTGNLAYNSNTGEFTYTPVEIALNDISDLVVSGTVAPGDIISYTGSGWVDTTVSAALNNASILDLGDVGDSAPSEGNVLAWNGVFWGLAEAIAPYGTINFGGYPTPTNSSIGYVNGDPILSHDNTTAVEVQFINRPGYTKSEIHCSIHADVGGDIALERRWDEFDGGNWIEGTWTEVTIFGTPSTLSAGGTTYLHFIDIHSGSTPDKINYRLVAKGNVTIHYGKNNTLTAKQIT
jgi:hypothetical protein